MTIEIVHCWTCDDCDPENRAAVAVEEVRGYKMPHGWSWYHAGSIDYDDRGSPKGAIRHRCEQCTAAAKSESKPSITTIVNHEAELLIATRGTRHG